MYAHGILLVDDYDSQQELVRVAGADIGRLAGSWVALSLHTGLKRHLFHDWEHLVGKVVGVRKVMGLEDLVSFQDRALYDDARGKPFIKVVIELSQQTPKGGGIISILQDYKDVTLPSFAAGGSVLERTGNIITDCILNEVSLTMKGVHPAYCVRPGAGADWRLP